MNQHHEGDDVNDSVIDWADLAGWAKALPAVKRTALALALRDTEATDRQALILDIVRSTLADEFPDMEVACVVFTAMDFDNGNFITGYGDVYTADGTKDSVDFNGDVRGPDTIDTLLTDEYGSVGAGHAVVVDPRTGEFDDDTYGEDLIERATAKLRTPPDGRA